MLKVFNAVTIEADDAQFALDDLMDQLSSAGFEGANAAGFFTCTSDFIETGVAAFISKNLPFDVMGATTVASSVNGGYDYVTFCLTVIEDSDIEFSLTATAPLNSNVEQLVEESYKQASAKKTEKPALILSFFPVTEEYGGEEILNAMDTSSDGVPIYGLIYCDTSGNLSGSKLFLNGVEYAHSAVYMLIYGDLKPEFRIAHISSEKIQKHRAEVTKSSGNLLMELNNVPARQYFEDMGLLTQQSINNTLPLFIDYGDGSKLVARGIFGITPEGYFVCGGKIPKGCTVALGVFDREEIVKTSASITEKVFCDTSKKFVLLTSCYSRYMVLGPVDRAEMDMAENASSGLSFHLAYAGGEMCPVYDANKKPVNRFHNFTFTACII